MNVGFDLGDKIRDVVGIAGEADDAVGEECGETVAVPAFAILVAGGGAMTPRRDCGYSLAELVIVLVVAGIITAIAIPMFNQPQIDAAWYHEQVRSAVRHAQRTAVAQRRAVSPR